MTKHLFFIILIIFNYTAYTQGKQAVEKFSLQCGFETRKCNTYIPEYDSTIAYKFKTLEVQYNIFYCKYFTANISLSLLFRHSGININIQQKFRILPYFIDTKNLRTDLYIPVGYSLFYFSKNKYKDDDEPRFVHHGFRFGLGTSYNFSKKLGIFGEYYFHILAYEYKPYLQLGILYSWNKND